MIANANPQIDTRHQHVVTLRLHGVAIDILSPTTLYRRDPSLQIAYAPQSPSGQCPVIQLRDNLTMGDLCAAIGLRSYDVALPYAWVKAEYLDKGLPWPRGVWSYDGERIFGDFVPLEDMLSRLGQSIAEIVGYAGLCALDCSAPTKMIVAREEIN